MTVGIFFPNNLPKVVMQKTEDKWRNKMAAMYIEVNLLCGSHIKVKLVDQNIDCWNMKVKGRTIECTMKVQLSYHENNCLELSIVQLSIVPPNKEKCDRVKSIAVHLLKQNTITTFASKLSSMLP